MVLFDQNNSRSSNSVEFAVTGPKRTRVLITGLVPGPWQARRAGSSETHHLDVAEDTGAAWFETSVGTWTLTRSEE